MKTLRITHINKYYWPTIGGIEMSIKFLAEELATLKDTDIQVLVCNNNKHTEIETINNVQVVRCGRNTEIFSMPLSYDFYRRLGSLDVEILHFHHPFPPGEIFQLLRNVNSKIVITWHSDIVRQKILALFYGPLLKIFLKKADCILTTSTNYIKYSKFLGPFKDKCKVVPLGIDPEFSKIDNAQSKLIYQLKENCKKPIILFVGRLVSYKGVEYLLEAMQNVNGYLFIVGDGPLRKVLQDKVTEYGISNRVSFFAKVSNYELPAYYASCDIFVLPSVAPNEAFGLVQLEAMMFGKPIISTNLPTGVPFVNQHEKTGIVVPAKDAQSLAAALNKLIIDSDLRDKFGNAGKQRFYDMFTKKHMGEMVYKIYQELLG